MKLFRNYKFGNQMVNILISIYQKYVMVKDLATMKKLLLFLLFFQLPLSSIASLDNEAEKWYKLARVYFNDESNYSKSLDAFNRFFDIADKTPGIYADKLAIANMSAGYIYMAYSDYVNALTCYQKSYNIYFRKHNFVQAQRNLNNIAQCYIRLKRYRDAQITAEKIIKMKNVPTSESLFDYYDIMASLAEIKNEEKVAESYWYYAVMTIERYGMEATLKIEPLQNIGKYLEKRNQLDSALVCYRQAYALAKEQGQTFPLLGCTRDMMRIYTKLSDKNNSLLYQNLYFFLSDSLMHSDDFLKVQSLRTRDYRKRTNKEMKNMTLTITRQKAMLIGFAVIAIIILVIIILLLIQKRRLDIAYHAIYERNKDLVDMEAKFMSTNTKMKSERKIVRQLSPVRDDGQLFKKIQAVISDMNEVCNPDFSLNRLTTLVGANTSYVSQVINSEYGKNFRTLINELRVREAQRRIIDAETFGNLTIQAIGESVGFSSQTTFNRTFKHVTGITPSVYQKMAEKDKI